MNKIFSKKLWTALSVVLASLLALFIVITDVAIRYSPLINATLGIDPTETIDEGDGTENTNYFPAEYTTEQSVRNYASDVSERVEAEGLTLLKNDNNALPLGSGAKVSLFLTGSVQLNCSAQGLRNANDYANYPTLRQALEDVNVSVNPTLWDFYTDKVASGYGGERRLNEQTNLQTGYIREVPWTEMTSAVTDSFSDYSDAAIVVITRDATEGSDAVTHGSDGENGNYLALSPEEKQTLEQLTLLKQRGVFDSIVVLLNYAVTVQLDFLMEQNIDVDAVMWIGNVGMSGINAVADALVGNVNPSGRLTDTFVYDNFSSPAMASWMLSENKAFANSWNDSRLSGNAETTQQYYGVYVEGIYVGYRYYETRYADLVEGARNVGIYDYNSTVAFPFGYGLSYTQFEYSNFTVTAEGDDGYNVSVLVTNTGEVAGKNTVQIYLQKPYTDYARQYGIEVAAVELVGFDKTTELEPGASEEVTIYVSKEDFTSYDVYGAGTYILDEGDYYLATGNGSHEAVNNILAAKGYDSDDGMTTDGDEDLAVKALTVVNRDTETYSVSSITGNPIGNKLEDGDINRYSGAGENLVTYVSRSNWEGTWPTKAAMLTLTDEMVEDLQNLTIEDVEESGTLPLYGQTNGLTLAMMRGKDYDDEDWDKLLDQMSFDEINTLLTTCISQTPAVQSISKPRTQEMDGPTYCKEGITGSRFPCEAIWAATYNTELIAEVGAALANDARLAGYSGMWIPGINIHRVPYGGRNHEYFSEDPYLTGVAAQAEITALQSYGVIAQPKHYAFNEQEMNRGGIGIWLNEQSAREIYLEPWKYAVAPELGNSHALMTAFNRFGCKWVSADANLMGILRDEFGFEGYVITDMADAIGTQYMTALDGILAGTDCWLSSGSHSFAQYRNSPTVTNAMREAAKRILYNVCNYSAAMNGYSTTTRTIIIMPWWQIALISVITVFAVVTAGCVAMLVVSEIKERKGFPGRRE